MKVKQVIEHLKVSNPELEVFVSTERGRKKVSGIYIRDDMLVIDYD